MSAAFTEALLPIDKPESRNEASKHSRYRSE
jgi:hypothetical protein